MAAIISNSSYRVGVVVATVLLHLHLLLLACTKLHAPGSRESNTALSDDLGSLLLALLHHAHRLKRDQLGTSTCTALP